MKLLIITMMLTFAANASQNYLNLIDSQDNDLIRKAVKAELESSEYTCKNLTPTMSLPSDHKITQEMITIVEDVKRSTVSIKRDLINPEIEFIQSWDNSEVLTSLVVVLDRNFKSIISYTGHKYRTKIIEVNVGTILDPVFEKTEVKTTILKASCTIK